MNSKFNLQDAQGNYSSGISNYNNQDYIIPQIDILEDDNKIYYVYELSELDTESLKVELSEEEIFVQGNTKIDKDKDYTYQERAKGTFFRKLPLPSNSNIDTARADFKGGVLKISFSKRN